MNKKPEETSEYFEQWYLKNKEAYNAKRRANYAKNDAVRNTARANSKRYRELVAANPEMYKHTKSPNIPRREFDGILYEVIRLGDTCEMVGISDQTLRAWEAKKLIPKSSFVGRNRVYTEYQVNVLRELVTRSKIHFTDGKHSIMKEYMDSVKDKWHPPHV